MSEPRGEVRPHSWFRAVFRTERPLEKETALFILASALDFYMTYLLLDYGSGGESSDEAMFYESNPLARFFLDWGMHGLVFFKFSLVAFVTVIAQVIAAKRLRTAQRLLNFATALVACVVIYSFVLLARYSTLFGS